MYAVIRIDTAEGFEQLRDEWAELFDRTEHANIFGTFDWLHTWWQSFGDQHRLYILTVRRDNELIGLAPLMISEGRFIGRPRQTIRFIGTPEIDYGDFLGSDKEEICRQVGHYLAEHRADWTDLDLSQISERSETVGPLRKALKEAGIRYRLIRIETCSSFVFEGTEEERAVFKPRRNKGLKGDMNFFERNGGLDLTELTESEQVSRELYGMFHCHVNRWENTATPSFFLQRRYCEFYQALAECLAPKGRISMLSLRHNGLNLAYQFNFMHRGKVYLYTLTHNLFHRRRAPGIIINYLARQKYVQAGCTELDFVRGGQAHKSRLTNHQYQNYQIRVYSGLIHRLISQSYDKAKTTALVKKIVGSRRLRSLRDRIALHYRQEGIGGLIKKGFAKVLSWIFDTKVVFMYRFEGSSEVSPKADIPVENRLLEREDLDEIASFLGIQPDTNRYQTLVERFEKDADCFASFYNGHIACMGWGLYHEDRNPVTGFSALPTRKQVLFSDGFTSPVLRGRHLRPHLMAHQLNHYRERGLQCITAIYRRNKPSLRVVESLHFKKVKSVRQLRILGISFMRARAVTVPEETA